MNDLKKKAAAILAREEHKKPRPGQRTDHDSPDVRDEKKGKSAKELAELPVPEPE